MCCQHIFLMLVRNYDEFRKAWCLDLRRRSTNERMFSDWLELDQILSMIGC